MTPAIDPDLLAHFDDPGFPLAEAIQRGYADPTDRPEVRVGVDIHRIADEMQAGLVRDPLVYKRNNALVVVSGSDATDAHLEAGTPIIKPLNVHSLLPRITRHICTLRVKPPPAKAKLRADTAGERTTVEWVECMPTPTIVNSVLHLPDWPAIHSLLGVIETPSIRPDGTVIATAGYDLATGYLYAPSMVFPEVPEAPTQADAKAAMEELCEVFVDFPFSTPEAKYVPIAAILSLIARPAIQGAVPGFCFDAPTPGTGKSLCSDSVCLIATGRTSPKATFPKEREELEKVLASHALSGDVVVGFDNVSQSTPFGGDALDKCLTAVDYIKIRVLGQTSAPNLIWKAVVIASGNNMRILGDTKRRVVMSRLESPLERPEERKGFKHGNLREWIKKHRGRLVGAALTVLRAHAVANRPACGVEALGSFEEWSLVVGSAIVFAGGANVTKATPNEDSGDDGVSTIIGRVTTLLSEKYEAGVTLADLLHKLYDTDRNDTNLDDERSIIEDLSDRRERGIPNAKSIANVLRSWKSRPVGKLKLISETTRHGMLWKAVKV